MTGKFTDFNKDIDWESNFGDSQGEADGGIWSIKRLEKKYDTNGNGYSSTCEAYSHKGYGCAEGIANGGGFHNETGKAKRPWKSR